MEILGATRPRVVVAGGGFAGLETAFYLRHRLGDRADLLLVSDRDHFVFKPNTIYIPFGLAPEKLQIPLELPARRRGIALRKARVTGVRTDRRMLETDDGPVAYDLLAVATGAGMRPEEIPGLSEYALTIWTSEDMLRLRTAYETLVEVAKSGVSRRVLFLVPPGNKCSGPLYEMVFMLDTHLRRQGVRARVELVWSTYEDGFIQAFGPKLDTVVGAAFEKHGITGWRSHAVERVEGGAVHYANGETIEFDLLVSFPPYVASVAFAGLPSDARGFLSTEPGSRQVKGQPDVYAVGDAGDFPVKQAFLAFLQADAAAEHLACRVLGEKASSAAFDPVSMCVMERFDTATFAQVPLLATGDPLRPVVVRPGANGSYRVGTHLAWRAGKKLLGAYLPWRFRAGLPFHAGIPWRGMEMGLKVMSRLLAA